MELSMVRVGVINIGSRAYRDQHVLSVLSKNDVSGPMTASGQLGVTRYVGNDGFRRPCDVHISDVIRQTLDCRRISNVDILRVYRRIKGDSEGMIQPGGK